MAKVSRTILDRQVQNAFQWLDVAAAGPPLDSAGHVGRLVELTEQPGQGREEEGRQNDITVPPVPAAAVLASAFACGMLVVLAIERRRRASPTC